MQRHFLICLVLFMPVYCIAQTPGKELYVKLSKSQLDTNRINILKDLGWYYKNLPERKLKDIDTGLAFFKRALLLSQQLRVIDKEMQVRSLISSTLFDKKEVQAARTEALLIIDYYSRTKNIALQAKYTFQFGADMPSVTPEEFAENISTFEEAARLYGLAHNRLEQLSTLTNIAYLNVLQKKYDLAEKQLLDIVKEYNAIGYNKLVVVYDLLATVSLDKSDFKKELEYRLDVIENMEASKDTSYVDGYYFALANTYFGATMYQQCLEWANRGLQYALQKGHISLVYNNMDIAVISLVALRKPLDGIALIKQTAKVCKPTTYLQELYAFQDLGYCFNALGRFEPANKNYISADSIFNIQNDDRNFGTRTKSTNYVMVHYLNMATFYIQYGKYKEAKYFTDKAASLPHNGILLRTISMLHWQQFKLDSAAGNYLQAISHLGLYQKMQDSIFNETKTRQMADMTVKYETDKKEQAIKALQIQEQQAVLEGNIKQADLDKVSLQRNLQAGQLKQAILVHKIQESKLQKITLQQNADRRNAILQHNADQQKANFERNIQQAELQRSNSQRNITFGGVAMLMVISGLTYNGYRNKRRSNRVLEIKQIEINGQNISLQNLLTEKDWLLKEVHHRVKNNLQIVMSLLNTQSYYLQNSDAIDAIRESQNRVQSIALIHQKLYSTSNLASIDMPNYVAELVNYLADGFDTQARGIRFKQLIAPLKLDLAQAVPLGLILNEAITNCIKYAFTKKGSEVIIALQVIGLDRALLTVADNGKGLPADFDIRTASSLGMEMMKALSKQLGGHFDIKNQAGTRISIDFQLDKVLTAHQKEVFSTD